MLSIFLAFLVAVAGVYIKGRWDMLSAVTVARINADAEYRKAVTVARISADAEYRKAVEVARIGVAGGAAVPEVKPRRRISANGSAAKALERGFEG